jgi:hypothetical protein
VCDALNGWTLTESARPSGAGRLILLVEFLRKPTDECHCRIAHRIELLLADRDFRAPAMTGNELRVSV